MLEAYIADTINMTGLETSGNSLPDEFINILLEISLGPGCRAKITYETFHKLWRTMLCSFIYATQHASERKRGADMSGREGD